MASRGDQTGKLAPPGDTTPRVTGSGSVLPLAGKPIQPNLGVGLAASAPCTPIRQAIVDQYADDYPEMIFLEPAALDAAIVGVIADPWDRLTLPVVVYDTDKVIAIFAQEMSWEDAAEHFSVNTEGAWVGAGTPVFLSHPYS